MHPNLVDVPQLSISFDAMLRNKQNYLQIRPIMQQLVIKSVITAAGVGALAL